MDELETVSICTHYRLDGQLIDSPPVGSDALARCEPVYEQMPGWQARTAGITSMQNLPAAAAAYVQRLEQLMDVPVHIISTGPERRENIVRHNPLG